MSEDSLSDYWSLPEVETACRYLSLLMSIGIKERMEHLIEFEDQLKESINQKYRNHWHIHDPVKGSAFRSISVGRDRIDPIIVAVCLDTGTPLEWALRANDHNRIIFVDPGRVSVRIEDVGVFALSMTENREITQTGMMGLQSTRYYGSPFKAKLPSYLDFENVPCHATQQYANIMRPIEYSPEPQNHEYEHRPPQFRLSYIDTEKYSDIPYYNSTQIEPLPVY